MNKPKPKLLVVSQPLWLPKLLSLFFMAPSKWGCVEEQSVSVLKEGIVAPRWRLTRSQTLRQQLTNYEIKPLPGGHLGVGIFVFCPLCWARLWQPWAWGYHSCAWLKTASCYCLPCGTHQLKPQWWSELGGLGSIFRWHSWTLGATCVNKLLPTFSTSAGDFFFLLERELKGEAGRSEHWLFQTSGRITGQHQDAF